MLVFDDFGSAAAKHKKAPPQIKRGHRRFDSRSLTTQTQAVVKLLGSAPSEMAEAADNFLTLTGQMVEQMTAMPSLASEQAAELIRLLASPAAQDSGTLDNNKSVEKVKLGSPFIGTIGPNEIFKTLSELGNRLASRPHVLMQETSRFVQEMGRVISGRSRIAPTKGDRRFEDSAWRDNPLHRMSLHGYLTWSNTLDRLITQAGADNNDTERMRYIVSLFTEALSPDNALLSNPAALKKAMETGGGSLVEGLRNLLRDIASKQSTPTQVDKSAFQVGSNLAATPGAVVFRNEVLELIQYTPVKDQVFAIPIMMVPPVVNKYYMMDTSPGRSLVEFMVSQGFQVFMVSWRNPSPQHSNWGLDTYVAAMLEACEAIRDITGSAEINTFTICTGAVPLASLLGYIAAKKLGGIKSATMVVSILDSNEGRSLGLFATPEAIQDAKQRSAAKGLLTGEEMSKVFTWMRAKDLVWNYWVNNYLMGKQPPAMDILYWNNDPTRLTARMHSDLLDIFSDDLLVKPGAMEILGTPIDLSQVDCDTYVVAGITDHISVWKGVYNSARKFGGQYEFVLHSSGHVQSVINPPGTPKAKYWVNPKTPFSPEDWLTEAEPRPDSWWLHWGDWLARHSGDRIPAPPGHGNSRFQALDKAPGTYVVEP